MADAEPTQDVIIRTDSVEQPFQLGDAVTGLADQYQAEVGKAEAHLAAINQRLADSAKASKFLTTPDTLGSRELNLAVDETARQLQAAEDEFRAGVEFDRSNLTEEVPLEYSIGQRVADLNANLEGIVTDKLQTIIHNVDMANADPEVFARLMSGEPADERVVQRDIDLARGVHGLAGGDAVEDIDRAIRAGSDEGPRK
ncbi:hypothetical protein KJ742_06515 [Patescibacteria group bacterium]|nr:hypothetical protein [Patescibacteria group bacterium]MBU1683565.1 hypothetical protein [Patescibacteria group bacterium]MBU1935654.1 hypothetical protein [Patescibacteria group bacterium]